MTEPADVSLDTVFSDYCREEGTDEECAAAHAEWTRDLDAVGAVDWTDCSSISGTEIAWTITLRQLFSLKKWYGWFDESGYYSENLFLSVAANVGDAPGLFTTDDPVDANHQRLADTIESLWEEFKTRDRYTVPAGEGRPRVEIHTWQTINRRRCELLIDYKVVTCVDPHFEEMVLGAVQMGHAGPLLDWLEETAKPG
jgi:hypothetical protein